MNTWNEPRARIDKDETIDREIQQQINTEKEHIRQVLFRIIVVVKFLAKHSLAFRVTNEKLYSDQSGNFYSCIEMIAEFDLVIHDHLRRIQNKDTRYHYLSDMNQDELVLLLASDIKNVIIKIA
jgi:hypothetical protein